jgi:hypothetical protein
VPAAVARQLTYDAKYSGYIARQDLEIQRQGRLARRRIPESFDFAKVQHLRAEALEKLQRVRPIDLAQAGRISGITPADLAVLLMYIKEPFVTLSVTDNIFGVDKLHLFTEHFDVSDLQPWNLVPNTKRAGETDIEHTPLLSVHGETVHGQKLYVNSQDYTAEVKHGRLHVQFNPSKMHHDFHLVSDMDKIADAITRVQNHLKETLHTDADLFTAGVSRIDITAQAAMQMPVPHYDAIIRGAKNLKRAPRTEYPHGFLMGNGARQLCTYDKGLKIEIDSGIKDPLPSNFMRVETRMLNARAVKQHTPFETVTDVLTAGNKFQWAYTKTAGELLRIQQQQMQMVELSAVGDLVRTAMAAKPRQWLQFVMLILSETGQGMPTAAEFEQALVPLVHEGIIHRKTLWQNVRDYSAMMHQTQMMRARYQQQTEQNYADRHAEFIAKFIEPYRVAL